MSGIPLLDAFIADNSLDTGRRLSVSEFETIVRSLSGVNANTDVPGSTATALYAGQINGRQTFQIANDLADRTKTPTSPDGQLRILDNTNIGKFLLEVTKRSEIGKYVDLDGTKLGDLSKSVFSIKLP